MNNDKKLSVPLLIIIIAELILCFVVYAYKHNRPASVVSSAPSQFAPGNTIAGAPAAVVQTQSATITSPDAAQPDIMIGAKSFAVGTLHFLYPKNLAVSSMNDTATVHHSVAYAHTSTCNEHGMATQVPDIADVNITFAVKAGSMKATMGDVAPENIAAYQSGNLNGYRVTSGAASCGSLVYYFPISEKKTLVVTRVLPAELSPYDADYAQASHLPGIISAQDENVIFTAILSSASPKM